MDPLAESLIEADEMCAEAAERLAELARALNDAYSRATARGLPLGYELDGLGPRVQRMATELARVKRVVASDASRARTECEYAS